MEAMSIIITYLEYALNNLKVDKKNSLSLNLDLRTSFEIFIRSSSTKPTVAIYVAMSMYWEFRIIKLWAACL